MSPTSVATGRDPASAAGLAHGWFYSGLARLGTLAGSLGFMAVLSRQVSVAGFGEYTYALSIAMICGTLAMFGLDQLAIRELSQQREDPAHLFGRALALQGIIGGLCLAAVVGIASWQGSRGERILVLALVLLHALAEQASTTFASLFRARARMDLEALTTWVWAVGLVSLTLVAGLVGLSLPAVLLLAGGAYVLRLGAILGLLRGLFGVRGLLTHLRPDARVVRAVLPLVLLTLMSAVYNAFPRLVVDARLGVAEVGMYGAAERVVQLITGLFAVVDVVIFPLFARAAGESTERFAAIYERTADAFLVLGLLVGIGCASVGREIVAALFGPAFDESTRVVIALVPSVSMGVSGFVSARALISLRRDRLLAGWLTAMVAIGLPATWWAAARWQLLGVAVAWSVPIAMGFLFFFVYLRTRLALRWLQWRYAAYFTLFALAFGVSVWLQATPLVVRTATHLALMAGLAAIFDWNGMLRWRDVRRIARSLPGLAWAARG